MKRVLFLVPLLLFTGCGMSIEEVQKEKEFCESIGRDSRYFDGILGRSIRCIEDNSNYQKVDEQLKQKIYDECLKRGGTPNYSSFYGKYVCD